MSTISLYKRNLEGYTRGFMGFNALAVMVQSCIGGIAAMTVLQNGSSPLQMVQLFLVVIVSSFFNGSVLAQQKPKTVFNLLLISVVVNTIITILNAIIYLS